MFRTLIWSVLGLAAAASGPIALYWVSQGWNPLGEGSSHSTAAAGPVEPVEADLTLLDPPAGKLPLEGAPVDRLAEVVRFDVSTGWIMQRWPRVSTGMADLQLQGYRVPLMTGAELSDLAGSLTYYFNSQQKVQRITFTGTTGDARKIVSLVIGRFGFARRMTNDAGLFVYEAVHSKHDRKSILQVRLAPVVKSNNPYRKFDVTLSIERPPEQHAQPTRATGVSPVWGTRNTGVSPVLGRMHGQDARATRKIE